MMSYSDSDLAALEDAKKRKATAWHFNKEIPLSMILALLLQAGGFIWWFGGLSSKVDETKSRVEKLESQRVSERVSTLEYQRIDDRGALIRIENKLDRLIEKERQ